MRKDPQGYYATLRVSPDADSEEIELAYSMLKDAYHDDGARMDVGKIGAAYDTLCDPERRASYDLQCLEASGSRTRIGKPGILIILLVVFGALFVFMYGQSVRVAMTSFSPGDTLYLIEDGSTFGTVLQYEPRHQFFNGAEAPAYLVKRRAGEPAVWFPSGDLAWTCQR